MGESEVFDVEAAARRIAEENHAYDERAATRRIAAIAEAKRLAGQFRAMDGNILEIWGFGSTFEDSKLYRMDSDIDLAIAGGDILRLFSVVEASSFDVDLVDIGGSDDEFSRLVKRFGTRL